MEYGFNEIASDLRGYLRSGGKVVELNPLFPKGVTTVEIDGVAIDIYYNTEYNDDGDCVWCEISIEGVTTPFGNGDLCNEEENELAKMIEDAITA